MLYFDCSVCNAKIPKVILEKDVTGAYNCECPRCETEFSFKQCIKCKNYYSGVRPLLCEKCVASKNEVR